jgi:hypothetical protein
MQIVIAARGTLPDLKSSSELHLLSLYKVAKACKSSYCGFANILRQTCSAKM